MSGKPNTPVFRQYRRTPARLARQTSCLFQCKTLSKSIALLKRAKSFLTYQALIKMHNSLVLPHFTYCSNDIVE